MKTNKWFIVVSTIGSMFLTAVTGFAQGSLTPSGAPAPTMKTLAQIEPRTPISSLPLTISTPGSYYFTTNLTGPAGVDAISINADNVTIDLNGFCLTGSVSSGGGINGGVQNYLCVRNGTIAGFSGAVVGGVKVGDNSRVEKLIVENSETGIFTGIHSVVADCLVVSNTLFGGINVGLSSRVEHCVASFNTSGGIFASAGSTISGCVADGNGSDGIDTGDNINIRDCTACNNSIGIFVGNHCLVSSCVANSNTGNGIQGSIRLTVTGCVANNNGLFGIIVSGDSRVTDCHASANGVSVHGAGIITTFGSGSVVDGNQVRDNVGYGIQAGGGDVVIRNFVGSNSTNFLNATGVNFGPIATPATASNPMANVAY